MPELPEVETTRRGIAPHVTGASVTAIEIRQPQLRWPVSAEIVECLPGQRLASVERRAKYLLLNFDQGVLLIHLGMSGNLRVVKPGQPVAKHDHIDISFDNGWVLRYTDPRRFGAVLWTVEPVYQHKLLKALGPEPLSPDFTGQRLFQLSRGKQQAVKTYIMDNGVVVGVGNIYANEALFQSGIDPRRAAGNISKARYQVLADNIKIVLGKAIEQGGTTLRDFVGGDGKPGYFKQELKAYGRGGEPCVVCNTTLKEVKLGQRASVYCPKCQR